MGIFRDFWRKITGYPKEIDQKIEVINFGNHLCEIVNRLDQKIIDEKNKEVEDKRKRTKKKVIAKSVKKLMTEIKSFCENAANRRERRLRFHIRFYAGDTHWYSFDKEGNYEKYDCYDEIFKETIELLKKEELSVCSDPACPLHEEYLVISW